MCPPEFWKPLYIDCEPLEFRVERAQNRFENPYSRLRSYYRNDIEYVSDLEAIEEQRRLLEEHGFNRDNRLLSSQRRSGMQ